MLCRYYHRLLTWREEYAPTPDAQAWHPLFVEALWETDPTAYLDVLISGGPEEKAALVTACREKVAALERRLAQAARSADIPEASRVQNIG